MKFFEQNSLSPSLGSLDLTGKIQRIDNLIFDHPDFSDRSNHASGTRLNDAMKKFGIDSKSKTTLKKRIEFENLIKSHLEPAFQMALRLTGNSDSAEELVQETMLRAVRNQDSFQQRSQFQTWLYRILINAFHDQFRRSQKHKSCSDENVDSPSREQRVDSQAEANELGEIVNRLIAELPDRQKEVLILSTYHSLSNSQIAETLSITVANVHANLSTARKRLKQQLEHYIGPP